MEKKKKKENGLAGGPGTRADPAGDLGDPAVRKGDWTADKFFGPRANFSGLGPGDADCLRKSKSGPVVISLSFRLGAFIFLSLTPFGTPHINFSTALSDQEMPYPKFPYIFCSNFVACSSEKRMAHSFQDPVTLLCP